MDRSPLKPDPEKVAAWQARSRARARERAVGQPRSTLKPISEGKAQVEGQRPRRSTLRTGRSFAVTPAQRTKCEGLVCIVCDAEHVHPAHLISKSVCPEGRDDPRAVVPLCPRHHRDYDEGRLSLLGHLEPKWREELAFAVARFGLVATLNFVTGDRWGPIGTRRVA